MIEITTFADRAVAVFGLGRSGLATAHALAAGGAKVLAWDDNAERREDAAKAGVPLGNPYKVDWTDVAALILSPGVPLTHPEPHDVVKLAHSARCEVIGDVELFARQALPNKVAAITGTNGKSTTTSLTGFLLEACGRDVAIGGNLGTPVLDLPTLDDDGIYVIEMSSYQIDLAPSLKPDVGVLLNLSPDHIDRHGDMAGYIAVKRGMLENQSADQISVVGIDDPDSAGIFDALAAERRGQVIPVSVGDNVDARAKSDGIWVDDGVVHMAGFDDGEALVDLSAAMGLIGKHNWQNAAAALACLSALGCPVEQAAAALLRFPGLAHRMENVGTAGGIRFINDSKATNADATDRALVCFDNIIWIAGGRAKEGGIEGLRPHFGRIKHAFLIGESAGEFARTLGTDVAHTIAGDLDTAVTSALDLALAEDDEAPVVLLSPAAASFDQFSDFEKRGNRFRDLVAGLAVLHGRDISAGAAE
jgi:UDP-N-acetylmuramoylalanine--D-glutamate ligase